MLHFDEFSAFDEFGPARAIPSRFLPTLGTQSPEEIRRTLRDRRPIASGGGAPLTTPATPVGVTTIPTAAAAIPSASNVEVPMFLDPPGMAPVSFVHKRIFGAVKEFVGSGGNPLAAIGGFVGGGGAVPSGNAPIPGPALAQARPASPCGPGMEFRGGRCRQAGVLGATRDFFGVEAPSSPIERTPTRLMNGGGGAGLHAGDHAPFIEDVRTRRCLRGHVLGMDGVCHSKRDIRNADRMYPKPRRPLGTSGDLQAVTKASAFARRLKANEKKLKKAGRSLNP